MLTLTFKFGPIVQNIEVNLYIKNERKKIKLKNVSRSQTRTDENAIILLLGKFKHIKCQYANLRLIFDIKICN